MVTWQIQAINLVFWLPSSQTAPPRQPELARRTRNWTAFLSWFPLDPHLIWFSICGSQPTWRSSLGMSAYLMFISGLLLLKLEYLVSTYAKDWFHHILNPYTSGLIVTPGSGAGAPRLSTLTEHPTAGSLGPGVPCSVAELSQPDQHVSKALWHEEFIFACSGKLKRCPH